MIYGGVVELAIAAALVMWGRWLGGRYGAPRWIRWIAPVASALAIAVFTTGLRALIAAFDATTIDAPADRARHLAEAISGAMTYVVVSASVLVLTALVLLVLTFRHHWWRKVATVQQRPPYR